MSSNQKNSFVANKRDRKKLDLNATINPKQQKHMEALTVIYLDVSVLFMLIQQRLRSGL